MDKVLYYLRDEPGQTARVLANELSMDKSFINAGLYGLENLVVTCEIGQGAPKWTLIEGGLEKWLSFKEKLSTPQKATDLMEVTGWTKAQINKVLYTPVFKFNKQELGGKGAPTWYM